MLKNHQKGNVLFIILIAVALFAALTAAITQSSRGSGNMDRERGSIGASDIMAYAGSIEKTVARILSGEMSENGLSFANPVWKFNNGDLVETDAMFPNCTNAQCRVMDTSEGGIEAKTFGSLSLGAPVATEIQSGHAGVYSLKITGVGTTAHDLVLLVPAINRNTCIQINRELGIDNPGDNPPEDTWAGAVLYDGTFSGPNNATDEIGDMATQVQRKNAGCVARAGGPHGTDDNWFYQVLLPR